MAKPDFLVHHAGDSAGVVVVEGIDAGQELRGLMMETKETIVITALDPIPLGHKIALDDIASDATIMKYGHDIGRTVAAVKKGGHLHTHNLKTKKW